MTDSDEINNSVVLVLLLFFWVEMLYAHLVARTTKYYGAPRMVLPLKLPIFATFLASDISRELGITSDSTGSSPLSKSFRPALL